MRSAASLRDGRCACFIAWGLPGLYLILPANGTAGARRCRRRRNRFVRCGGMGLATESGGRERILERIRAGLRVSVHQTPAAPIGQIFAPVENPLERFQQECKANLMECQLTADASASAQALAQVLQSLPAGEIFVQDDPALRRLMAALGSQRQVRWSSQGGRWRSLALAGGTAALLLSGAVGGFAPVCRTIYLFSAGERFNQSSAGPVFSVLIMADSCCRC